MTKAVLISIICPDSVGLVSAVTSRLYDIGANLDDTTFAVLGEGAEFTSVAELPDGMIETEVEQEILSLPEMAHATVKVSPFTMDPVHRETANITHRIIIGGGDRPGLIARLSEVFMEYDANIVRLNSQSIIDENGTVYSIRIAVSVPPTRAKACMATVFNTASELGLKCEWQEVARS